LLGFKGSIDRSIASDASCFLDCKRLISQSINPSIQNEPKTKKQGGPGASAGRAKTPSPPRGQAHEPAWLGTGAQQPAAVAAAAAAQQHTAAPAQQPAPPPPPSGQVPQLVTYMRVANFALCILMCVAAVLTVIVPAGATPASWVLAFYVLAFSCLLCCFEVNLRQVAKHIATNFGFLYDAKSRAVFLVL